MIRIIPVSIRRDIKPRDDISEIILKSIKHKIRDDDILVIAHKIVSKAEGRVVKLSDVKPAQRSINLAKKHHKDPRIMQLILQESANILRAEKDIIISETRHGLICANAGIDQSNVQGDFALLLPADPDKSAAIIRNFVKEKTDKEIAVIISDTFGRPFREGQVNVAIGLAGIKPVKSFIGSKDMYGRKLRVSEIAIADEIASSAELVMGKAKGIPVAIVRGYVYDKSEKSSAKHLQRSRQKDLFRH